MFVYGMRARGFSIGCQPMDGLIGLANYRNFGNYYDVISYSRKLTEQECDDYQLDYLGDDYGQKRENTV